MSLLADEKSEQEKSEKVTSNDNFERNKEELQKVLDIYHMMSHYCVDEEMEQEEIEKLDQIAISKGAGARKFQEVLNIYRLMNHYCVDEEMEQEEIEKLDQIAISKGAGARKFQEILNIYRLMRHYCVDEETEQEEIEIEN
ncbi:hypothetical protein HN011_004376 [Eciton burchellii]|nr:hypothetical protein HN011_004376 [Eciton burchellii]